MGSGAMIAAQPIGIRRYQAGAKDAHGNPVESWSSPVEALVYAVYQLTASEPLPDRDEAVAEWSVLAPVGVVLAPRDRVVFQGVEFEALGTLAPWSYGPFGWEAGNEFRLRRVEG